MGVDWHQHPGPAMESHEHMGHDMSATQGMAHDVPPKRVKSAEEIALAWDISREDMDALAVVSHERAIRATEEGRFKNEIIPLTTPHGVVDTDQGMRPGTSLEGLAKLKTPFRDRKSTRLNSSHTDISRMPSSA